MPPPMTGLIQWFSGDVGLSVAATRVSAWTDQSPMGQDLVQSSGGEQPYQLGETINGIPLVTFGVAGDANKHMVTSSNLLDSNSDEMNSSSPRTVMVVAKPRFDAAWGRTGGVIWQHSPNWMAMAEMRSDIDVDGAYAWFRTIGDYANALQFTPVTGGVGGPYDGRPVLYEWVSSGFPALDFAINGISVALTPSTMYGSPGGAGIVTLSNLSIAYLGGIAEILVWDHALSDPDLQAARVYISERYGSNILVCTCEGGPQVIHTNGITAFADHLDVEFSDNVVLSGPALDVASWYVTNPGPTMGREVVVGNIQVIGDIVRLAVTPQTLNANYTLNLPTVGITSTGFAPFTGLYSLDFLGVPTPVAVQMVKVIDTHTIDVIFGIAVNEEEASNPFNYTLDNGLTVVSATRITDFWYRLRNTPRQVDAITYNLIVSNIGPL